MTCKEAREVFLSDKHPSEVTRGLRSAVKTHIRGCDECHLLAEEQYQANRAAGKDDDESDREVMKLLDNDRQDPEFDG